MPKYKVVIKQEDFTFFDTIEITEDQATKLKEDPNLLSIEEILLEEEDLD